MSASEALILRASISTSSCEPSQKMSLCDTSARCTCAPGCDHSGSTGTAQAALPAAHQGAPTFLPPK